MLLTEVSELRDQLTLSLDQNLNQSIEKVIFEFSFFTFIIFFFINPLKMAIGKYTRQKTR